MYEFYTYNVYNLHACNVQYSQRHTMINHCDRHITLLSDLDISFVLLNISLKFLLHLECYLLSPKRHIRISKCIKHINIKYISVSLRRVIRLSLIYHAMSLTVLYTYWCEQQYINMTNYVNFVNRERIQPFPSQQSVNTDPVIIL